MNLQPFYELKERLEQAAIAGVGLLDEDFRLRRAVDALAPLAAASPVFGKISTAAKTLLAAPAEERPARLLDTLSLVSAVAYTQGVAGAAGELTPRTSGSGSYVQAAYGQLSPLLQALCGAGSGRFAVIKRYWEEHPDYFGDFRVLPHMVAVLGDSYAELSDLAFSILRSQGETILPLLKQGFDPAGRREMVRRVELLEAIAGAGENAFYLSELEGAEKEVRSALIYALHHEEGNAEKLVELCQTERGNGKKAAHWALARLQSPVAWAYWDELAAKDPVQTAEYMTLSTAPQAGELVAAALDRWLSPYEANPHAPLERSGVEQLQTLLLALPGKSGPAICRLYRRMAALGTALDNKGYPGPNKQTMALRLKERGDASERSALPFSQIVPVMLRRGILLDPTPDLLGLAMELGRGGGAYQLPALTAALLSKPAGEALTLAEPLLKPTGLLQKKRSKEGTALLSALLLDLHWEEEAGSQAWKLSFADSAGHRVFVARSLREQLDEGWFRYLTGPGGDAATDLLLCNLLPPGDEALRQRVGKYLYQRALTVEDNRPYLTCLKSCDWQECHGLLEAHCKRSKANTWEFLSLLDRLPGTPAAVADEGERVFALIQSKKIAVGTWNPTQIEKRIADLRGERLKSY